MLTGKPVSGKTYSLFGSSNDTGEFYSGVNSSLEKLIKLYNDEGTLLKQFQLASKSKRAFNRWIKSDPAVLEIITELKGYTHNVKEHLRSQSPIHFGNNRVYTKEYQYPVYFLEFALVNRMNKRRFLDTEYKLALLPHCIRIDIENCKAKQDEIDYKCVKCSKNCYIKEITDMLEEHDINSYLWMNRKLRYTLKAAHQNNKTMGVLGIACIPELISGMGKCMKYNLPVVGLPLNANRCIRWMGDFYENSVNLNELEKLVRF